MSYPERRVVVFGKTGNGKSSAINHVFGDMVMTTTCSMASGTKKCDFAEHMIIGRKLLMVDTPGLYDTDMSMEETEREIAKVIGLTAPGFHACIFVLKIGNRFTNEEISTIATLVKMFGEQIYHRSILLFTGTDNLQGKEFKDFIAHEMENNVDLKNTIENCGKRCIGFYCRAVGKQRDVQVKSLMDMIDEVVTDTGNTCYTDKTYEAAVDMIKKENDKIEADLSLTSDELVDEVGGSGIKENIRDDTGFGTTFLDRLKRKVRCTIL